MYRSKVNSFLDGSSLVWDARTTVLAGTHTGDRRTLPAREEAAAAMEEALEEGGEGVNTVPLPARPVIQAGAEEAVTSPLRYVHKILIWRCRVK